MNRQFLTAVFVFIIVCFIFTECYGWSEPLYIDSDWQWYVPVGASVEIDAWVTSDGPVDPWIWDWGAGEMGDASYGGYSSSSEGHFNSPGSYRVYVDAYGPGGWDDARTYVDCIDVVIDIPSSFPAYVGVGESLSLGCTPLGVTGGTFGWSKVSGPGNVTFSPSVGAEDPSFSADQPGDYTVQVLYSKGATVTDTSGTIKVVAVDNVISSKTVACIGENVTFGAQTNPPNCAPYVTITWSGGQNPATGSGSQFITNWSTTGTKTVTATCGTSNAQKQVTIVEVEQNNDLWWFNGENPTSYPIEVTLTAQGTTTGTFKWDVVAGTGKVNFENDSDTITNTNDNTVKVKSTAESTMLDDITINFTYNGSYVCNCTLTVYAPDHLDHIDTNDINWMDGYESHITYDTKDQFDRILPYDIEVDEVFTSSRINDYPGGSDWNRPDNSGTPILSPTWQDVINAYGGQWYHPDPQNPQSPLVTTKVDHWSGDWYIGSQTDGSGVKVKSGCIWQRYLDHARHE